MGMMSTRFIMLLTGIVLLVGIAGCGSSAAAKPSSATYGEEGEPFVPLIPPGTGLFGSHEFRSTLKALPNWTRVMEHAETQADEFYQCDPAQQVCSSAALSWQKIIKDSAGKTAMEQLKAVNLYFNRWPYRLDIDVYGVSDYWATPSEFLRLSGDCEDYSIAKYYALKQLGFPATEMRIVLLKDTIRNISHAVLVVALGGDTLVLDNMSELVLSHTRYQHYVPQYSVNEFYRWAHVSPTLMRHGMQTN